MDDKSLSEFIERASRLSRERSERLSRDEVRAIALETGLSEEDLEEADRQGRQAMQRGEEFMARKRWSDAIAELEDAVALLPSRSEPRVLLGRSYAGRFLATGDKAARRRAEEIARRCLKTEPDNEGAYEVLDLIAAEVPGGVAHGEEGSKISVTGLVVAAVFGGAGLLGLLMVVAGVFWLAAEVEEYEPSGATEPFDRFAEAEETLQEVEMPEVDDSRRGTHELDVELQDETDFGLDIDVRSSTLDVYRDSSFYRLKAMLINDGEYELDELRAKVEFFDGNEQLIATSSDERILDSHEATLRPGDVHGFGLLIRANPDAERVRLIYDWGDGTPAGTDYSSSSPVDIEMGPDHSQWKLEVAERSQYWRQTPIGEGGFFRAAFEVTNDGGGPIRLLKVEVEFFDAGGSKIGGSGTYVVASGEPPMLPGETRLFSSISSTSEDYDHYRLSVASMR